jgi:hypothetical protein
MHNLDSGVIYFFVNEIPTITHHTETENTTNTATMSAMDLDAPVSIAPQQFREQTNATYEYLLFRLDLC